MSGEAEFWCKVSIRLVHDQPSAPLCQLRTSCLQFIRLEETPIRIVWVADGDGVYVTG